MNKKIGILAITLSGLIVLGAIYAFTSSEKDEIKDELDNDEKDIPLEQKERYYDNLLLFIENKEFIEKQNFKLDYSMTLTYDNQNIFYLAQRGENLQVKLPAPGLLSYWIGKFGRIKATFQENMEKYGNDLLLSSKMTFEKANEGGENNLGVEKEGWAIVGDNTYILYELDLENKYLENGQNGGLDNLQEETGGDWERIVPGLLLRRVMKRKMEEEAELYMPQLLKFLPITQSDKKHLDWDEVVAVEDNKVTLNIDYDSIPKWKKIGPINEGDESGWEGNENMEIVDMEFEIDAHFIENKIVSFEAIGSQKMRIYENTYTTRFQVSFDLHKPHQIKLD